MEFSTIDRVVFLLILFRAGDLQVYSQCAGAPLRLTATSGSYLIAEVTYPTSGSYGESLDCNWLIESSLPSAHKLLIYIRIASIATNDYIRIYDGKSTSDPLLYMESGNSRKSLTKVASSGNIYVHFMSDGIKDTDQEGFHLKYMSASTNDFGCTVASLIATDSRQYITTSNFPQTYPGSTSCTWTITAQNDCGTLVLDFKYINVEGCSYDFITLTYDDNPTLNICENNDWNSAHNYTTSNTSAIVTMTSDDSDEKNGFVMAFSRSGCASLTTDTRTNSSQNLLPLISLLIIPIIVLVVGLWKLGVIRSPKVESVSTLNDAEKSEVTNDEAVDEQNKT